MPCRPDHETGLPAQEQIHRGVTKARAQHDVVGHRRQAAQGEAEIGGADVLEFLQTKLVLDDPAQDLDHPAQFGVAVGVLAEVLRG